MRVGKKVKCETEGRTWFLCQAKQLIKGLYHWPVREKGEKNVVKWCAGALEKVERRNRQNQHDSDWTCKGTQQLKDE